jgi:hypothetical protein
MKRFAFALMTLCLISAAVSAQTPTGRLSGTVSGPDGVLPGAAVTATDIITGKEFTATTDSDGRYVIFQLQFGTYTVTAKAKGFKTFVATEVKIDVGREYSLPATLEVGSIEETVTVIAGADIVTSTTAQISNTVSPQQILELPLITRNPLSLILLQAGTTSNTFQNTTINGMRTTLTNITRDGINIQDVFIRTNATDFAPGRPSVDDTGEFTINAANPDADQGYGGAQVRLVTPRGSKDFHGALFAYNRNSHFAANNFFNNRSGVVRPFRNRNQFGGKVSGPLPLPRFGEGGASLIKNKAFFFSSYEGIQDPQSSRATRTILLPSARNRAFQFTRATAGNATAFCPLTTVGSACTVPDILAFANQVGFANIPTTVDATIQNRVLAPMPTVSNAAGGDGLNTAGFALNRQSNSTRNTFSNRIDVDANESNSFSFIFNYNKESNLRPDVDTNKFTVVPDVIQTSENKQYTASYRRSFGSSIVNEVRGGRFQSLVPFDKTDPTPAFFMTIPLVTNPEDPFLSQGRYVWGWNLQDNVDWVKGKHSFKFGGQLQYFGVNAYNDAGIVPVYTVQVGTNTPQFSTVSGAFLPAGAGQTSTISSTNLGTANSLLALLGGVVNAGGQSFNAVSQSAPFQPVRQFQPFRYANHSLYIQDRWQVKPKLTLTLGLRYELFPAMTLDNGLALETVITDINNPLASLLARNGTYGYVGGNAGSPSAYYKTDKNNFAPVLGFAYSMGAEKGFMHTLFGGPGKSVLRGGYSHIYGNDSIVTSINNSAANNVGLGRTASNSVNAVTGTTSLNDRLFGNLTAIAPPPTFVPGRTYLFNNSAAVGGNFGTAFGIDPKVQIPQVKQYSFGIQREFGGSMVLEVRYVGTRSNNLARATDFNQVDIFNNGFLTDFNRAAANRTLTGNAFCNPATTAGCQALSIFQVGAGSAGRLGVGTGGLSLTTFNNNLAAGTPADLATSFITNALNNHPTVANPTATPFLNIIPNPATGVVDLFHNDGYYQYNSLQVEVRRRLSQGLYFQANYTFSKNLTNAIGTSQGLVETFLDNNNQQWDKARADFDVTHVFNFNGIYDFPFGKGQKFLNNGGLLDRLVGGWELSGLASWTSGAPITLVDARGTLNRAGRSGRQTPNTTLTNDQIRALTGYFEARTGSTTLTPAIFYINPSVINLLTGQASTGVGGAAFAGQSFFSVKPGQTGNMARSVLNGPGYFNVDAALLKTIRIKENTRVQLRMEAFNMLNHTNFAPGTQFPSITSATFGQLTSAFAARQIQFAVRFEF